MRELARPERQRRNRDILDVRHPQSHRRRWSLGRKSGGAGSADGSCATIFCNCAASAAPLASSIEHFDRGFSASRNVQLILIGGLSGSGQSPVALKILELPVWSYCVDDLPSALLPLPAWWKGISATITQRGQPISVDAAARRHVS